MKIVHGELIFKNNNVSFNFPCDICESNGSFFVSDNERHCLFKLDIQSRTMYLAIGCYDNEGQDDGPMAIATLSCPSGITSQGSTIYVAEHPREYQDAIRIIYSLQSLADFQKMWTDIPSSMGHFKTKHHQDPDFAKLVKTKNLRESRLELEGPAEKLKMSIKKSEERANAAIQLFRYHTRKYGLSNS